MIFSIHRLLVAILSLTSTSVVMAAPISWTDWTNSSNSPPSVSGTLTVGTSTVDVNFSGDYSFVQTSGGTNYWNPPGPYLSSTVENAPPASDIIALGTGGSATITFSETVQDPLLALVSWNGNVVDFLGTPIEILSFGRGFWGSGTPILNSDGDGFVGNGEVHGVIRNQWC